EGGLVGADHGQVTWVLDPIDGTVNFLYGIPAYAVSVGVRRDGVLSPLRCSQATDLSMALVGTGFAYERERRQQQGEIVA
ncbi:inositol monophosphatase, partial [Mycobacterium sp. ITM-2017-0098]